MGHYPCAVSGRTAAGTGEIGLTPAAVPTGPGWPARLAVGTGEVVAAVGAALGTVALSHSVTVDPLDRVGQVSGLAALDLRFVLLGLAGARGLPRDGPPPRAFAVVSRLACAAIAGLATGLVAGGVLLALRGTAGRCSRTGATPGQLIRWADDLLAGRPIPADYPPADPARDRPLGRAHRRLHRGRAAHRASREHRAVRTGRPTCPGGSLLAPGWALVVALVAGMPMLEPYKPYTTVGTRRARSRADRAAARATRSRGADLGAASPSPGSAPGSRSASCSASTPAGSSGRRPGRWSPRSFCSRGARRSSAGSPCSGWPRWVWSRWPGRTCSASLHAAGTVQDRYFYFDTAVEPAYIAMWRNDLPGDVGPWPPLGELAGVGVFSVLLVVGLGVAVAVARPANRGPHPLRVDGGRVGAAVRDRLADVRHADRAALPAHHGRDPLLPAAPRGLRGVVRRASRAGRVAGPRGRGQRAPASDGRARPRCHGRGAAARALHRARPPRTGTCRATTGRSGCSRTWRSTCGSRTGRCPDYSQAGGCAPDPGALLRGDWPPRG